MKQKQKDELQEVSGKIAEAEARRVGLAKERAEAAQAIDEAEATLGSEILNAADYAQSVQFIARERIRAEGLQTAEKQIAAQIEKLEEERRACQFAIDSEEYEKQTAEAKKKLSKILTDLYSMTAELNTITLNAPRDYKSDETELIRNLWMHIRGLGIYAFLADLEPRFPELMQSAKAGAK